MINVDEQLAGIAWVDTETTGLDPDLHEIWEVALGLWHPGNQSWRLWTWQLPVDIKAADDYALTVGQFKERFDINALTPIAEFADTFAALTNGLHLAGNVVSFDEERLRKLLRSVNVEHQWHYHMIDIEAMIVAHLEARGEPGFKLPWSSNELSKAIGVDPDDFPRHTAAGDVEWAVTQFHEIMGLDAPDFGWA